MPDTRCRPRIVSLDDALTDVSAAVVRGVMLEAETHQSSAQVGREPVPRSVHRTEARVSSGWRNLDGVQRAGNWWIVDVSHVRMPHRLTRAKAADGNAVLHDVGHDVNLGMALDEPSSVLLDGREVQIAKVAAEREQVFEG